MSQFASKFPSSDSVQAEPVESESIPEKTPPAEPNPLSNTLAKYLTAIRSISKTAYIVLPHIENWRLKEIGDGESKLERLAPGILKNSGKSRKITVESIRELVELSSTLRELKEHRHSKYTAVLAKSLFTQLFAEFDAYTGALLKIIYLKNDQLLKSIRREISLTDLLGFEDINAAKISMLDKEIETFRRDSYIEQFSALEKKFDITLKKFKEWSAFVELSQRRNIIIHNGGVVNDQYLQVCKGVAHCFQTEPKVGDPLPVSFEYLATASRLLSKVGLMLAFTLWSKVSPMESQNLHKTLNDTIYTCLEQKRWRFVAELEDFVLGTAMCKGITDVDLRMRIINIAIGTKLSGDNIATLRILNSVDWSASHRDFQLAKAVLSEQYDHAINIMKSIGQTGEMITQAAYHSWPLFTTFKERPEFHAAYFQIYDVAFSEQVETEQGSIEAHAKVDQEKKLGYSQSDHNAPELTSIVEITPAQQESS